MSWDPFRILGVDAGISERGLRVAFRRLVHELHPDRRVGDPRATERLREVVAAYEAARAHLRGNAFWERPVARQADVAPAPRERLRYACARCDDTYAFEGECSHCDGALTDSWQDARSGTVVDDPRIAPFVAALEARGEPQESLLDTYGATITMVTLGLTGALALGVYAPVGTMFLGYAMVLGGVHMKALLTRPAI